MKHLALIAISAAALTLSGCGKKADEGLPGNGMTDMATDMAPAAVLSPGQTFANTAAASDTFEIETSKLAVASASSAAVKKFADRMITAHTASTEKLKTAAAAASPAIVPDAQLTAMQQQTLDGLKAKSGAEFDAAYKTAQVDGHQATLDALKAYAATGDVPSLKTLAGGMVPTVAAHLNMAKALK